MKGAFAAAALALVVGVRCDPSAGGEVAADAEASSCIQGPTWLLVAQPLDLSTGVGTREVAVVVQYAGGTRPPSQAVFDEVATAITVRNGSQGEVAVQVVPRFGTPSNDGVEADSIEAWLERQDRVLVAAASPWLNEWHSLAVAELPCKYQLVGFKTSAEGRSGVLRFHPQPLPIYRSLQFCDYGHGKGSRLLLDLSQPVADRDQISTRLSAIADGSDCSFAPHPDDTPGSDRVFEAWCDANGISNLVFAVNEPLTAGDGQAFAALDGRQAFSVAWPSSAWVVDATGCWTWSP